ncbi:MAG TPA: hypothetical protein ENN39_07170 [Desulfonatronum sp.]|nr:hypothetical protein [Desulfonatronum sp.]
MAQSLGSLADYLLRERIITKNLKQRNLVYQIRDQGPGRMFLVDDVGDTDFIPLSRFCKIWAEKKIQRKWTRFEQHLLRSFAHNPWIGELIAKIHVTRRSGEAKYRSCQI